MDRGCWIEEGTPFYSFSGCRNCNPNSAKISPKKVCQQCVPHFDFAKFVLFRLSMEVTNIFWCTLKLFRRLKLLSKKILFSLEKESVECLFQNLPGKIQVRFSLKVNDLFLVRADCVRCCSIHSKASSLCREGL